MKTPYGYFVSVVARIVGGAYPEHYDSDLKTSLRIILPTLVGINTFRALTTDGVPPRTHLSMGIIAGMAIICANLAYRRKKSIEEHVLRTSIRRVRENDEYTASDAVLLYDYLKVCFALLILYYFFLQSHNYVNNEFFADMSLIVIPLFSYYGALILCQSGAIIGRWVDKYRNKNDINTPNTDGVDS